MTESAPDGVLDLLGLLAYAELIAFFRLSDDAALAPSLADKAALGEMAVAEFGHFRLLCGHISLMGAQPDQASGGPTQPAAPGAGMPSTPAAPSSSASAGQ